jgi:hypothetical protein
LIEGTSPKAQAARHYKGGFGFHPLTSWSTNIGDALAVMQRPGNAGSFIAADHLAVLTATFTQIPARWRTDVLVSIDGAGASHDVIDYFTSVNTAGGTAIAAAGGSTPSAGHSTNGPWPTPTATSTPPRMWRT